MTVVVAFLKAFRLQPAGRSFEPPSGLFVSVRFPSLFFFSFSMKASPRHPHSCSRECVALFVVFDPPPQFLDRALKAGDAEATLRCFNTAMDMEVSLRPNLLSGVLNQCAKAGLMDDCMRVVVEMKREFRLGYFCSFGVNYSIV